MEVCYNMRLISNYKVDFFNWYMFIGFMILFFMICKGLFIDVWVIGLIIGCFGRMFFFM